MNMSINSDEKINKTFRLYDETIWIVGIGILYLTYKAFSSSKSFELKLYDILNMLMLWVIVLFKIHVIRVQDSRTIIFQGIFRKIILNPREITEYQEWVRGGRLVYQGGSIILWPYIEKQGELKRILRTITPEMKFRDITAEGTKTNCRVAIIVLAMFAYFGWLIWSLFHKITQSFKWQKDDKFFFLYSKFASSSNWVLQLHTLHNGIIEKIKISCWKIKKDRPPSPIPVFLF